MRPWRRAPPSNKRASARKSAFKNMGEQAKRQKTRHADAPPHDEQYPLAMPNIVLDAARLRLRFVRIQQAFTRLLFRPTGDEKHETFYDAYP